MRVEELYDVLVEILDAALSCPSDALGNGSQDPGADPERTERGKLVSVAGGFLLPRLQRRQEGLVVGQDETVAVYWEVDGFKLCLLGSTACSFR